MKWQHLKKTVLTAIEERDTVGLSHLPTVQYFADGHILAGTKPDNTYDWKSLSDSVNAASKPEIVVDIEATPARLVMAEKATQRHTRRNSQIITNAAARREPLPAISREEELERQLIAVQRTNTLLHEQLAILTERFDILERQDAVTRREVSLLKKVIYDQ